MPDPILAISFDAFSSLGFWTSVGILAGIYTIFALGLQLNVGFTGIFNFGQAGFMAVGAYTMAILITDAGFNMWIALVIAILVAVAFGLLVGLPSLRLRADYFAIATIAASEAIRLVALNARGLTGGSQGIFGFDEGWDSVQETIEGWLMDLGWSDPETLFPLFLVVWAVALSLTFGLSRLQATPWGRVLRAIREDEDAARALGKNVFSYKLQSLAISAGIAAIAGFFVVINLRFVIPDAFLPTFTFLGYAALVLGGLANYWGVAVGAIILQTIFEGLRFIDLEGTSFLGTEIGESQIASLRFMLVGLALILLMAFRPQGMFGKREEMVIGD